MSRWLHTDFRKHACPSLGLACLKHEQQLWLELMDCVQAMLSLDVFRGYRGVVTSMYNILYRVCMFIDLSAEISCFYKIMRPFQV